MRQKSESQKPSSERIALKEVVAEQALELRLLKKSMIADGDGEE
jgi:hypothetical protein